MSRQEHAFVGLGGNVGDARGTSAQAIRALGALPGTTISGVSRLYRTRAVGPVDQADFLNAVVSLEVPSGTTPDEGAMALLLVLKQLERTLGRQERERWGPREIDLDLLLFGRHELHLERGPDARSDDPARPGPQWLDVPHMSASERLFVLAPLADLEPDLQPPGWPHTVAETRAIVARTEPPDAVLAVAVWDAAGAGWRAAQDAGQTP